MFLCSNGAIITKSLDNNGRSSWCQKDSIGELLCFFGVNSAKLLNKKMICG